MTEPAKKTLGQNIGIARKFIIYLFVLSFLITAITTSVQLYLDYSTAKESIEAKLKEIKSSHLQGIINSMWVTDYELLKIQLEGILVTPDIQHLSISNGNTDIIAVGNDKSENIISHQYPLIYSFRGKSIKLGTLHVIASLEGIQERLINKGRLILINESIKIALISMFLYFLFYYLIGKHLTTMSNYTKQLDFKSLDRPLVLKRIEQGKDELDQLVMSINSMRKGLAKEVKEREQAEKALIESEAHMRALIETIPDLIWLKDPDGVYISCNPKFERFFGAKEIDIIGKTDHDFLDKELADFFRQKDKEAMVAGKPSVNEEEVTYADDGHNEILETVKTPMYDSEGKFIGVLGTARDISERKKIEAELQQMQKLESIGILAGGIAHDFNNILAGIITNIYLSKMDIQRDSPGFNNLESAEKAILRAKDLTQRLLTFARGGDPVTKAASIVKIIKESAEFILTGSNVICDYHVADDLLPAIVDEGQISQVIQNLVLNSSQAMPEGGTIHISMDNIELVTDVKVPLEEGRYVKIVIQDKGTGMSEEHLTSIFDPYFTTKDTGRGLGLSIAYSVVKSHKGHISVESEIGAGTTFTIYLPASERPIEEVESRDDTILKGHGKILLMDDEEMIRKSIGQFLEISGYEVEYAEEGNEAIALYKKAMEASKPFDAVILDMTIRRGMGGKESIKKLLGIDPDVKAIVSSGYSNDPIMADFREYGFSDVLAKPFNNPNELIVILHRILKA